MKKATSKSKQALRNRTRLEWVLFALLILIAYLLMASRHEWWPWNIQEDKLGTAFYVVKQDGSKEALGTVGDENTTRSTTGTNSRNTTTNTTTGTSGTNGTNGSNGSNGQDGGDGGSSSSTPLLNLAANLDTGLTKQQLSIQANGLNEKCSVIADLPILGKQEVCVYTEGDKIVTVTLINGEVISASRSGF